MRLHQDLLEFCLHRFLYPWRKYKKALKDKLVEELNEVLESTGNNRIEELSDMIEVITSLAKLEGKTLNDVIEASSKKKEKRGGFDNKIFLVKVTTKE